MAEAIPPEDSITCPICLEVYQEPHQLTACSHTFCLQCIQQLSTDRIIQCPKCRVTTNIESIQMDNETKIRILAAKTAKLTSEINGATTEASDQKENTESNEAMANTTDEATISADNQSDAIETQSDSSRNQTSRSRNICNVCERRTFKCRCVDCAQFMCDDCLSVHAQKEENKTHTIKSVQEIIQISRSKIHNALNELIAEKNNLDKQSTELEQSVQQLHLDEQMQLDYIDKVTDESINMLRQTQEDMTKKIQETNDGLLQELQKDIHVYEETMKDLKGKVAYIEDQMSSGDVHVMSDTMKHMNETIIDEVERLKENLPKREGKLVSPIVVTQDDTFDPSKIIDVVVDRTAHYFKQDDEH